MSTIRIQAEITGYQGSSANVLGALDPDTGLFIVAKDQEFGSRLDGALVVSNDPRAERRDSLFGEDKMQDAIRTFFRIKAAGLFEILPAMARHDPTHKIEAESVSEYGTRYKVNPDISNGAMAVLALALMADTTYKAQAATSFANELADMFLTI